MEVVLDCEYIHASRTFVVFDVFGVRGKILSSDYRQRLHDLAGVQLPVLAGIQVVKKVIYPLCVLTQSWYDEMKTGRNVDGVVIHNGSALLGRSFVMYKWKPDHTVDLYVGPSQQMMDGRYTDFLPLDPDNSQALGHGEIWECAFTRSGTHVQPIRRRIDKPRANARHVCREILRAHLDNISICDVQRILQSADMERKSKRKRV